VPRVNRDDGLGGAPEPGGGQPNPSQVDCAWVRSAVWYFLDCECAADACDRLLKHLMSCGSCRDHYENQARFKQLIATRCGGDKAPGWLRLLLP
jgi:mycothiol system anti-sigma-R factor